MPVSNDLARRGTRAERAAQLRAQMEAEKGRAPQPAATATQQDTDTAVGTAPVGAGDYVVKQGDCIASIAKDTGHFWQTIWDHPSNAELKSVREDPNVLLPGDRLTVPEKNPKSEPGQTEQRHRFVRKGEPCRLRLRLMDSSGPIANAPFVLLVDNRPLEGMTDARGQVDVPIPGNAAVALLRIRDQEIQIRLGRLDPLTELSGIRDRLSNLNYDAGPPGPEMDAKLAEALRCFQRDHDLAVTGAADEPTRARLREAHAR